MGAWLTSQQEERSGVFKRTGDYEVLVTPNSAIGHWADCIIHNEIAMNRCHEDLPKFNGRFDPDYLFLRPYLQKIWRSAVADVQRRFDTQNSESKRNEWSDSAFGLLQLWPSRDAEESINKTATEFEYVVSLVNAVLT